MQTTLLLLLAVLLISCQKAQPIDSEPPTTNRIQDSLLLAKMIEIREKAMIQKDIGTALTQFSYDATWINSQGHYAQRKGRTSDSSLPLRERGTTPQPFSEGARGD